MQRYIFDAKMLPLRKQGELFKNLIVFYEEFDCFESTYVDLNYFDKSDEELFEEFRADSIKMKEFMIKYHKHEYNSNTIIEFENGVTGYLPTTMTVDMAVIRKALEVCRDLKEESKTWAGSQILGCHAEGPFISESKKGAQDPKYILKPDAKFVKEAEAAGFMNLKGHRLVGGMRASIYNAMSLEGVKALVDFMDKFAKEN